MDPSCIRQPVSLWTQPNDGNGDCLFTAVAQALNAYDGVAKPAASEHFRRLGLRFGHVSAKQLRTLVYVLFLVPHVETDNILDAWKMVRAVGGAMSAEYAQVRALPAGKAAADLSHRDRLLFFRACMDRRTCWGEETALEFMERVLCIRCLVVAGKALQTRALGNYPDSFRPLLYVALGLSHVHYQSVLWTDRAGREHGAFAEQEIPDIFLYLSQRDCSMIADKAFINLASLIRGRVSGSGSGSGSLPVACTPHAIDASMVAHFLACQQRLLSSSLPQ